MDSVDKVTSALSLAHYMIEKLKIEIPGWIYTLSPVEVICLKEDKRGLYIDTIVR